MTKLWGLFVADRTRGFPNFFPIGIYSTKDQALEALRSLPQQNHYQLFELPLDRFFGFFNKSGELLMGSLPHQHFDTDEAPSPGGSDGLPIDRPMLRLHLFLDARKLPSAKRLVERIKQELGCGNLIEGPERYWKDPEQFEASIAIELPHTEQADGVLETMELCSRLAYHWNVGGPEACGFGAWTFSGYASKESAKFKVPGITFVSFEASFSGASPASPSG